MNEEKVKDLLREKGLKVTSQRLMVLNILSAHGDEHLLPKNIAFLRVHKIFTVSLFSLTKEEITILKTALFPG